MLSVLTKCTYTRAFDAYGITSEQNSLINGPNRKGKTGMHEGRRRAHRGGAVEAAGHCPEAVPILPQGLVMCAGGTS